ncbi:MAG: lysophospholipid acyltransferase family protein [Candidatus Omnitrophica bacterium]|nr:lysophospholipid acyltransferase family protein [Candidatus Omnitrophota bacterium]
MLIYLLYRTTQYLALHLPLKWGYGAAEFFAGLKYLLSPRDRRNVRFNLGLVTGLNGQELEKLVRGVFRNFGKYLVDFFRFSKLDEDFIATHIKFEGREQLDSVFKKGKGVILLTAHLGNWELGGAVIGLLKYPVSAVALKHKSKLINSLFDSQRTMTGLEVIPLGGAWRQCCERLKGGRMLGLLGDRDFTTNGATVEFFGKKAALPKGPASLSLATGAPVVPTFIVREKDDTFGFIFDKPIEPVSTGNKENDERAVMDSCARAMERYIKKYPDQWYIFRKFCEPQR